VASPIETKTALPDTVRGVFPRGRAAGGEVWRDRGLRQLRH
jgi:hypothetical protein